MENQCKEIKYIWPYNHEEWGEEKILQRATSYQEVLGKKKYKNTKKKAKNK